MDKREIYDLCSCMVERLVKWIEWLKAQDRYEANVFEDDVVRVHIWSRVESLRQRIYREYVEACSNYGEMRDEIKNYVECLDALGRFEDLMEKILCEYYRECAERELENLEEYSVIDGEFFGVESNFVRFLLRTNDLKALTSPAVEFRGKVLFMPTNYLQRKLGFKVPVEEVIVDAIAEEELHKVITKIESEEASKKLDNIYSKIRDHISGE